MKRWINTKVIFEWDGDKYVEKYVEGYDYEGELSLAAQTFRSGYGGGGGGGAGGNGGNVVLITSRLSQSLIDDGKVVYDVSKGVRGQYGEGGGPGMTSAGWGVTGEDGTIIEIIM